MIRTIKLPELTGAPLAELKQWLAIGGTRDDALLVTLIGAAMRACAEFTGQFALTTTVAERIDASCGWTALAARPFMRILKVAAIGSDGTQRTLANDAYAVDAADGTVGIQLTRPIAERMIEVTQEAGNATLWSDLDPRLRLGIVRHAAHGYAFRDREPPAASPAAIAALWQSWRQLRL